MNAQPPAWRPIAWSVVAAVAAFGSASARQVVVPPTLGVPGGAESKPSPAYDAAFQALAAGEFAGALELATEEYRGCTKIGNQRWIDSIAGAAVVGECHYERGDFARAVAAFDEALALAAQHPDWLLAIQFPAQQPRPLAGRRAATWGRSGRGTAPAALPSTVPIRWQAADPQEVLQRGGVLAATFDQQIRAQEIMRALTVALYRRAEILGELGRESTPLDAVARALARRPAPPNHYSQSWVDVALGMALWAQGKADQAAPLLTRGLTVGPGLDQPLTPWALIALGRIALDADRAADAAKQFEEATYAAADFGDARALEEGFRLAFAAHMLAGARGVPATIRAAADALGPRDGLAVLHARLLAMRAEALEGDGDHRGATAPLLQHSGQVREERTALPTPHGRGGCRRLVLDGRDARAPGSLTPRPHGCAELHVTPKTLPRQGRGPQHLLQLQPRSTGQDSVHVLLDEFFKPIFVVHANPSPLTN